MSDYLSPEYAETLREREARHARHERMLKSHINLKQERKEQHKRTGGKKLKYSGHLY